MATEQFLMAAVKAGGDRQEVHERIRVHSQEAAKQVKERGQANDLLNRLLQDATFANIDLTGTLDPRRFVGRAPEQVDAFLDDVIAPLRERYGSEPPQDTEVKI